MGIDVLLKYAQIFDVFDRHCPFGELKSTFRSEIGRNGREGPYIHYFGPLALQRVCGDGEDAISADDDGRFQVYESSRSR